MNAKYKILNYPQDIEACHDLINILVAELNEYAEFVLAEEKPKCDEKDSVRQHGDTFFSLNSLNYCAGANGGVSFEDFEGYRPRQHHDAKLRGSSNGKPCN